jgi:uncharacterized protein YbjQ (UPF0145 family)
MVEGGGIPLVAQERIQHQREEGGVFTSDLSVDELAALRGIGYEPIALVMGSSLYRMGWISPGMGMGMGMGRMMNWGAIEPQELTYLTAALTESRARAIHRLVLETQGLGAEGVVGVRLVVKRWEWATGMAEFTVLGTAVRRVGQAAPAEPFTSTLSGQDMAKLVSCGYRPLKLVMGASAFQAVAFFGGGFGMRGGMGVSSWYNQEVSSYSRALHQAQGVGRQRMALEAAHVGAAGVVGVEIESHVLEYSTGSETVGGRIVEWVILGTAVAPQTGSPRPPQPTLVVPLNS